MLRQIFFAAHEPYDEWPDPLIVMESAFIEPYDEWPDPL